MSLCENFPEKSCEIIEFEHPSTINPPSFNTGKVDSKPFEWQDYNYALLSFGKYIVNFIFRELRFPVKVWQSFADNLTTEPRPHHSIT